jgi:hypothetical protein
MPAPRALESPELRVRIDAVLAPEALAYGSDRERDLLADALGRVTASSSAGGGSEPEKCADGWMGTAWRSAANDATPWVELELRRAVRASRILITHADPRPGARAGARPERVELLINERERQLLTLDQFFHA